VGLFREAADLARFGFRGLRAKGDKGDKDNSETPALQQGYFARASHSELQATLWAKL
jgi:hypothetical protein